MERKEAKESSSSQIKKPSNKYKEGNPQAPDKIETKPAKKRGRKAASKKIKKGKATASTPKGRKKKPKHHQKNGHKVKKRQNKASSKESEPEPDDENSKESESEANVEQSSNSEVILSKEEQLERDKLILILLNEIIIQVKEFSDDKIIDYVQISENSHLLKDPYKAKELFESFKNKLIQSSMRSEIEHNCK